MVLREEGLPEEKHSAAGEDQEGLEVTLHEGYDGSGVCVPDWHWVRVRVEVVDGKRAAHGMKWKDATSAIITNVTTHQLTLVLPNFLVIRHGVGARVG